MIFYVPFLRVMCWRILAVISGMFVTGRNCGDVYIYYGFGSDCKAVNVGWCLLKAGMNVFLLLDV
jgi:hypothetical protein